MLGLYELLRYLWQKHREMGTRKRVGLYLLIFSVVILLAFTSQTLLYKYLWTYDEMLVTGDFYYEQADYEEAVKHYSRAARFNETSWEAFYRQGVALSYLERYEEAEAAFDRALKIEENKYTLSAKGYILASQGRHEEAIPYYNRALKIDPHFEYAIKNRKRAVERKSPI